MPFEDDLGLALREAVEASPPPRLELLATGAAQRGQRRKRRRTVLTSAACVVVLAGAGVVALQLRPTGGPVGTSVATGPTAATHGTASTPPPAATPSPSRPAAAAANPVPSSQVLQLLKGKLSAGYQLSHPVSEDLSSPDPGVLAGFTISNSSGKGTVSLTITHGGPRTRGGAGCGTTGSVAHCTDTPLPDGSDLVVWLPDSGGGRQVWNATLQRSDGLTLTVESGNVPGLGSGDTEPYPNAPLLTGAQLSALAEDPVWLPVMASIPAAS
ncbi:hypothetical protein ACFZB9_00335 [Kitasatospora sp. NPDC008050]|uniref:hypothetical protein n=1 Tax=Kitasatospora sp. NPDC008050 TaxID=3364021 RepID=UPI0036E56C4D